MANQYHIDLGQFSPIADAALGVGDRDATQRIQWFNDVSSSVCHHL